MWFFKLWTVCATALLILTSLYAHIPAVSASTQSAPNTHVESQDIGKVHVLSGKVIVLDAGHGGSDSGARGWQGMQEKDVTLPVVIKLANYLHEAGATVVTTRDTDRDLATDIDRQHHRRHLGDLKGRLTVVRQQNIDAFVSIHCNAAPSDDWRGAQVLYLRHNEEAKKLATIMQETFHSNLLPTNRSIQSNRTLYLLKRVKGPTVLAEIGFITNPDEASWLKKDSYQDKVALSMYVALTKYFSDLPASK